MINRAKIDNAIINHIYNSLELLLSLLLVLVQCWQNGVGLVSEIICLNVVGSIVVGSIGDSDAIGKIVVRFISLILLNEFV